MTREEQLLRVAYSRVKLRSFTELSESTGIPKATMYYRVKKPGTFTKRELRLIVQKTNMSQEELYDLVTSKD